MPSLHAPSFRCSLSHARTHTHDQHYGRCKGNGRLRRVQASWKGGAKTLPEGSQPTLTSEWFEIVRCSKQTQLHPEQRGSFHVHGQTDGPNDTTETHSRARIVLASFRTVECNRHTAAIRTLPSAQTVVRMVDSGGLKKGTIEGRGRWHYAPIHQHTQTLSVV